MAPTTKEDLEEFVEWCEQAGIDVGRASWMTYFLWKECRTSTSLDRDQTHSLDDYGLEPA